MVLFANLRRGRVNLIPLNAKCFWMVCCCGGKGINLEGSVLVLCIDDFGQGAGLGRCFVSRLFSQPDSISQIAGVRSYSSRSFVAGRVLGND